jgi:anhydro-N-acetylmuramic acid kinase
LPKNSRLIIGLMSGTSLDGVDAALVEISGAGRQTRIALRHFTSIPFGSQVHQELLQIASGSPVPSQVISQMNFLIGTLYAEAIFRLCEEARVKINQIDLVGSHGQTIFHQSEPNVFCGRTLASTLQIGEASIIAERTGVTTICDFRPRDMAAGGKGAPLIPYVDYLLFRHPRYGRILLNIGGIANVTILPAAATLAEIVAFDTGPGNMVIDGLVRRMTHNEKGFDRDGEIARSGKVISKVLKKLARHPYFSLPPPKTTGREQFGMAFLEKILRIGDTYSSEDLICTATELTVQGIAKAIIPFITRKASIRQLIVSGGGSRNSYLMQRLKDVLSQMAVLPSDDLGIPSIAKEAIGFAILANETLHLHPGNVPSATGASQATVLGKIIYGKNYKRIHPLAKR